jgi:hypothetical protein
MGVGSSFAAMPALIVGSVPSERTGKLDAERVCA